MTGPLGRALEVRGIPSYPEKLSSRIEGDIEDVGGIMTITRIRIRYRIRIPKGKRAEAERALAHHEKGCPAAMSVRGCIEVTYGADLEEEAT
ncbi:MAG TPA: OsmC family protein [Vicinamibacteria bacterium]